MTDFLGVVAPFGLVGFIVSCVFVAATYLDYRDYSTRDNLRSLRMALIAMLVSPLTIFAIPAVLLYYLGKAIKTAFTG